MLRFLAIVGMVVAAAVVFGILEYGVNLLVVGAEFAGAPVRGLIWAASGLLLGIPLALAARVGARPQRSPRSLLRPILILLGTMALFALAAGVVGFMFGRSGNVMLPDELKEQIPAAKWPALQACALAHQASYNVAFIGGGMLTAWIWVSRKRWREPQRKTIPPPAT